MLIESEQHRQHLSKVEAYYNKAQKFYETAWYRFGKGLGLHYGFWTPGVESRIQAIETENETLARMLKIKAGDRILDAGCGVGGSGIWLTERFDVKVVGVNIVQKQLRKGQKLSLEHSVENNSVFAQADYHTLPFVDNSFDVFWSLESIEHSDNVPQFVSEAHRVLKPGGRAVIAGTFQGFTQATRKQERQMNVGFRAAGAFNDFRSIYELSALMSDQGFHISRVHDFTGLVMPSAIQMDRMCKAGLPFAKLAHQAGIVSQIMVDNTQWGTYQKDLFESGVTRYNVIVAEKK